MRKSFILTVSFVFAAMSALTACGDDGTTTTGSGGGTGTGGMTGTGGTAGTGGMTGTGGTAGTGGMTGTGGAGTGGMAPSCQNTGMGACNDCTYAQCSTEYCACSANAECMALAQCAGTCMPNDQMCAQNCIQMHQAGLADFTNAATCGSMKCANDCPQIMVDPCTSCLSSNCSMQYTACFSNAECAALVNCVQTTCMPNDQMCVNGCLMQHPQGGLAAQALQQCLVTNCSTQCSGMMMP